MKPVTAYYNENDPFAAAWLRELINAGHLPHGVVDARSIIDVQEEDLGGFTQCHFFAGIGGWPYALHLAGWPDDRPVWSGSCPCQPFSQAGKGLEKKDHRHLWPEWLRLISKHRPSTIFGEQVASPAALAWWDLVSNDMEEEGYAVGAADLCAPSVGAPHIRQRLFWVGHSIGPRLAGWEGKSTNDEEERPSVERTGRDAGGNWNAPEWINCSDGKTRPTQPGLLPVAHGISNRVGRLRGYGNAIVPQIAAEFIKAFMEIRSELPSDEGGKNGR